MIRTRPLLHVPLWLLAAMTVAPTGCGQTNDEKEGIGLAEYRLLQGPIQIEGVRKDASGLAFCEITKSLWVVIDSPPVLVEVDLAGRLLRQIELRGFEDIEGIAHVKGNRFALVEERRYELCLIEIGPETKRIDRTAATTIRLEEDGGDNDGLEGVAFDALRQRFFCVKEKKPSRVYEIQKGSEPGKFGRVSHPWEAKEKKDWKLDDLSGLHFDAASGHLLVLSDKSSAVVECTPQGKMIARLSLTKGSAGLDATIPKAEGITMDASGRLYVCSEPNLLYILAKE
ncbi:MAG: SdiA-regulated domain-containing protein [Candidatus Nealsonbacteria bacterium]|nr:SdiA-regulated domain-containing protein [Candidatus Nealsonbacteria bacterium]